MADNLDEVFGTDEAVETVEPVVDVQSEPEVVEAPQEPEPEPPVVEARTEDRIPIGALLDEREKRKTLEAEIERLKQQAPQQQANIPDPYDDPAAYNAHMENRIIQERQLLKNEFSYQFAVRDHGKDTVEEARQWALQKAQTDPVFDQQVAAAFQTQVSPVDWIVQQHKRDGLVSQIGDRSIDDFVKDYLAKNPALLGQSVPAPATAAVVPASASPTPRVPRSLASQATAPSDVRQTATGPLVGVDALFT